MKFDSNNGDLFAEIILDTSLPATEIFALS
jgi:hypothetical protein